MSTKIELVLEQIQQGASDEVLVSIERVEELKRNVRINGLKKEALYTLSYLYDTCMTDEFNIPWLRGGHPVINVGDISVEASQLPAFYGRILPVLLGLDPSTAAIKAGHVSGVHHALQNAFLSCLRCTHPVNDAMYNSISQPLALLAATSIIVIICGGYPSYHKWGSSYTCTREHGKKVQLRAYTMNAK
ncbi:symplekin isoform X1 [Tanacetum coccineum]